MGKKIAEFKDEYEFLSNFYLTPVQYGGYRFSSSEAAFQAAKCPERMGEFVGLNPSQSKRLGRKLPLREDWEQVKDAVMYEICHLKFYQNPGLREKLLATGDAELIEGNTWGDRVWGVCDGVGQNRLGRILMRIRAEFGQEQTTLVRFFFEPINGEDDHGVDVFVKMRMPAGIDSYNERVKEIQDAISSYIDAVPAWKFEELAVDVCKSFDGNAEAVSLTTFYV